MSDRSILGFNNTIMSAKHRLIITIGMLMVYLSAFNYYIYRLSYCPLPERHQRLLYHSITFGMISFIFVDIWTGIKSIYHSHFNIVCQLSLLINILFVIFTLNLMLVDPLNRILFFNGLVLVATVMITTSIFRHGIIKN